MSLWKSMVLQKIREGGRNPDGREFENIRGAATPMQLWIELGSLFEQWHREPFERELIKGIYEYAKWCMADAPRGAGDAGSDPLTSAAVCFYEHLPLSRLVRAHIGEFMTLDEVRGMKDAFRYHIGDEGFDLLLREVRITQTRLRDVPGAGPQR